MKTFTTLLLILAVAFQATANCPVKDCCSMTAAELTSCRGVSSECPTSSYVGSVPRQSCDECPKGTCRFPGNGRCVCPEEFKQGNGSAKLRMECAKSHGTPRPNSAGKPELDRRRCWQKNAVAKCVVKDCCSMSAEELTLCRGVSDKCPSSSYVGFVFLRTCEECPRGTCRFPGNRQCLCPEEFMQGGGSDKLRMECAKSHGSSRPASRGKPDLDRRRCWQKNAAAKCVVKDCCSMSAEELTLCRGVSDKCPSSSYLRYVNRESCNECSRGTCRFPDSGRCLCPEEFMQGDAAARLHKECAKSHGSSWPASRGKPDLDRRMCRGKTYRPDGSVVGSIKENTTQGMPGEGPVGSSTVEEKPTEFTPSGRKGKKRKNKKRKKKKKRRKVSAKTIGFSAFDSFIVGLLLLGLLFWYLRVRVRPKPANIHN